MEQAQKDPFHYGTHQAWLAKRKEWSDEWVTSSIQFEANWRSPPLIHITRVVDSSLYGENFIHG
jgi:hypothetical protein